MWLGCCKGKKGEEAFLCFSSPITPLLCTFPPLFSVYSYSNTYSLSFSAQFEQLAIEGCIHKPVLAVLKDHSDSADLVEGSMEILIFLAQIGNTIAI